MKFGKLLYTEEKAPDIKIEGPFGKGWGVYWTYKINGTPAGSAPSKKKAQKDADKMVSQFKGTGMFGL